MRWIKRFGVLLCFVIALSSPVLCQQNSYPLQTAATATGNGNPLPNNGQGGVTVQVAGTFVGTVTFEVTQDGTNYVAVQGKNITDAALSTTATAPGVFDFVLGGSDKFRARISAYTSGSITVTARLAQGVISQYEGGGSGSGTVTQVTGVDTNGFTFSIANPTTTPAITLTMQNAAANGSTKGVAGFLAADFDAAAGIVSIDYTNAQKATSSVPGFLTAADWSTFNGKQAALGFTAENVANKDTDGTLAANSDTKYASQKATKTYADTKEVPLTFSSPLVRTTNTIACATCVIASSPSAGIAHFAGSTQTVTSSAIVNADITNGTIDLTAKVTGALPVANGGTGISSFGSGIATFLGAPTSANFLAAITNETGGGLVMGNDTPTIITPSITTGFTIGGVAASGTIPRGNGTNFAASAFTMAVPGTSGNVLTSDGTNWTSAAPAGGGGNPFDDGTAIIKGSGDATKLLRIEVDGFTTGTTRVITPPDSNTSLPIYGATITYTGPTAARTVTYPDASFTVARTDAGQTFTGVNTMTAPVFNTSISTPSIITASGALTITPASNAAVLLNTTGVVQIGGATSGSAGFKKNSNYIEVRLADDSARAGLRASYLTGVGTTGLSVETAAGSGAGMTFGSAADGTVVFTNWAGTDFGRAQFGGTTSAFGGLARDGAGIRVVTANSNTAYSFLGVGTNDSGTNTIATGLIIAHQSTGTPAAGLGEQILFNLNSSTTADQNAAAIAALWTTATHASRTADLVFYTVNNAASLAEGFRVKANLDAVSQGNLVSAIAGKGLQLQSGTGARGGNATLVGGTVTVTNTTVTANTVVLLTRKSSGGTIGTAITYTISAGASFTINSDNILDTSTFSYMLLEVN